MHRDALRATPIVRLAIKREDVAAIGARCVHGLFKLGKAALRKAIACGPNRHRDLDPKQGLAAVFAIIGQNDGVTDVAFLAQP